MIRKVGDGYKVYSEKGKPLSKLLKTYKEALTRLKQIEHYKE